MLPTVAGSKSDANSIEQTCGSSSNNFRSLKVSSALAGMGGKGRRALSSKSAHLTTIPFDLSFAHSPKNENHLLQRKPYLPFSASPSKQRLNGHNQKQVSSSIGMRNGQDPNGFRSESTNRARAHSHKNLNKVESSTTSGKTMPYLVDPTGNSKSLKQRKSTPPKEPLDSNKNVEALRKQFFPDHDVRMGEMIMTGTGKAPLVTTNAPLIATKVQSTRERLQVCRTKEEKDKSPDCIRLDKCALRLFPDIGGGESATLKLLSLQHNLITRLENIPLLSQLVVLDLYDNRVERICGLQGLPSLRVLLLGKNRIKRIEGMDSLKRLEILDLHGNQLRYVDNLGPLSALRVLNLAGNLLRNIRNLGPYGMSSLNELNLKRNRIKSLDGLQKAPYLKRLLIANNDLQNLASLASLRKLTYLQELIIEPNPLMSSMSSAEYKNQVLTLFPNLNSLDRIQITEEMKQEAKQWHKTKLAEEEARKREEARLKQEMAAAIGPPGSREQVIYQARRRWESLRTFVKGSSATKSPEGKPKPLKSMKDVVISASISAKTTGKIRPNFDELYPPATLDLMEFPDGQVELDKMESIVGEANQTKSKTFPGGDGGEEQCYLIVQSASDSQKLRGGKKSEISPLSNDPSLITPAINASENSDEIRLKAEISFELEKEISTDQFSPVSTCSNNESVLVKDASNCENVSKNLSQTQKSEKNGRAVLEGILDSARSNTSLNSLKSLNENKQIAKVAVIRPLIREAGTFILLEQDLGLTKSLISETISTPVSELSRQTNGEAILQESDSQTETSDQFVELTVESLSPTEVEPCDIEQGDTVETGVDPNGEGVKIMAYEDLPDSCQNNANNNGAIGTHNTVSSNSTSTMLENIRLGNNNGNLTKCDEKSVSGMIALDQKSTPKPEEAPPVCPENSSTMEDPKPSTLNAKYKLLRHLRSISLDSGLQPPPPLQPPSVACELVNLTPENDVEDEDDNENEVRDFECDYEFDGGGADDDTCGIAYSTCTSAGTTPRRSSTVIATTNRLLKNSGSFRKQTFPRTKSQRIRLRDRAAKLFGSSSDISPRSVSTNATKRISSGVGGLKVSDNHAPNTNTLKPSGTGKILRRCDSATSLTSPGFASLATTASSASTSGNHSTMKAIVGSTGGEELHGAPLRKQGVDFLVEVEGKSLNVFGQGGLRHAITAFTSNATCHVNVAKFHYISYDSIIPFFGKLRQVYPSLEHFHFRANNLCTLAQLDALSDLQGLSSLCIAKEGNAIVTHEAWVHYASYRLSHWGLQVINGKEVSSEYRGGATPAVQAKCFESLGFLALSCLPQSALTPLAKRLHMLHCFCCCSPSTSSDESNKPQRLTVNHNHRVHSPSHHTDRGYSGNFCTAWDDDPVLLDVIGKEALVYCPPVTPPENELITEGSTSTKPTETPIQDKVQVKREHYEKRRSETLKHLINSGVEIVEKVDRLERLWPTLMTEVIQEILMDYRFMDSYMKKELKKAQDATLIASNQQHQSKKHRH